MVTMHKCKSLNDAPVPSENKIFITVQRKIAYSSLTETNVLRIDVKKNVDPKRIKHVKNAFL